MAIVPWFAAEVNSLRQAATQRDKNLVIARQLLPLFEAQPGGWEALTALNLTRDRDPAKPFDRHLTDWSMSAPEPQRGGFPPAGIAVEDRTPHAAGPDLLEEGQRACHGQQGQVRIGAVRTEQRNAIQSLSSAVILNNPALFPGFVVRNAPTAADAVIPVMRAKLPYNLERDLAPVSLVAVAPFVLVVHPSVPVRNVKELIALARAQPGKLSYGSVGVGTTPHLSAEALKMMAGINILHVPFKGGLDNVIANASGLVDMVCASIPSLMPFIGQGTPRLRALAVTSAKRTALMPAVPSLSESGVPGYDRSSWVGILAPAAVPKDIVAKVNASLVKVINTAEMRESFTRQGVEPQTNTPEQFAAYISSHLEQNTRLIKAIGLRPE